MRKFLRRVLAAGCVVMSIGICTAESANAGWNSVAVDYIGDIRYTDIAIDADNKAHVSYYDAINRDLKFATNETGVWAVSRLDNTGDVGSFTSIALDANGYAHISYHGGGLKYATDEPDGTWAYTTVDSGNDVGYFTSIAIDSAGKMHISYFDTLNGDMKYTTNKSGDWVLSVVESGSNSIANGATSIALDDSDNVHICYERADGDLKYATNKTGSWTWDIIDTLTPNQLYPSLAIDPDGNAHISYYDPSPNYDLKYVTNISGSWVYTTIDSTGDVGQYTSIAVDANGKAHISYYNNTGSRLKYATNESGSWVYATLFSTEYSGLYDSLSLDQNGNPHIIYFDQVTHYLKYASDTDIIPPATGVTDPADGATIFGARYNITGTCAETGGSGMQKVEVSTDGGAIWHPATDTSGDGSWLTWSYDWLLPGSGMYLLKSRGTDNNGNIETLGPGVSVTVDNALSVGFYDDMESGASQWTSSGFWHMVENGVSPYPESHSPTHSMWFGQDANGNYDAGLQIVTGELASTSLYIPLDSPACSFWSWEQTEGSAGFDTRKVYISSDNGATWTGIYDSADNSAAWGEVTLDLSAYRGQQAKLKFVFDSVDRAANDYRGWYVDDVSVYADPESAITYPPDGSNVAAAGVTVTGTAFDNSALGIQVEVSTDGGGTWSAATDTSGDGSWATWSYNWVPAGPGVYNVKSRATDNGGHVETPGAGITVTAVNTEPVTTITDPADGSAINGEAYTVTGTAVGSEGSAVTLVEVSTDGGGTWNPAEGTDTWRYYMRPLPAPGGFTALARATDALAVVESQPATADITITANPWTVLQPDSGLVGWYTSIAVDRQGRVHMSYYDLANQDLKYATNASGAWQTVTVDNTGDDVGTYSSIALDDEGVAHISYCASGNLLKYATNPAGGWDITIVDGGVAGDWTAIGVDASGHAHISYRANTGEIKYATNELGGWDTYTVNTDGHICGAGSLDVDEDGKPHISYRDSTSNELRYADNVSGPWTSVTVDASPGVGDYTDIAVDRFGHVHISYYGSTGALLKYANNAAGGWSLETVDKSAWVGINPSIATANDGTVRISYFDNTYWDLKYASNAQGPWQKTTIDTPGYVGSYTAVALDGKGGAHVSYFDGTDAALNYATDTDLAMPYSVVTDPLDGASLFGTSYGINGTASPGFLGAALTGVEVSTDGGNSWSAASDISAGSDWSTWSYDWTLPIPGNYVIRCRATDASPNTETPVNGVTVTVYIPDSDPPSSLITNPGDGAILTGGGYTVSGTVSDAAGGTGVASVEISTDGGDTWSFANYTGGTSWSYDWTLPAEGVYSLLSRATDAADNVEAPGAGVSVTVDNGSPSSQIVNPTDGATISGYTYTVGGTASDAGVGVSSVLVSVNGSGRWRLATDTSGNGTWSTWSYDIPLSGNGGLTIQTRALDRLGHIEPLGPGVAVNVSITPCNGRLWAWGSDHAGQLGDYQSPSQSLDSADPDGFLKDVIDIKSGYSHTVALKSDGTVWAWGYGEYGQLGNNSSADKETPVQVTGITGVKAITAGDYHTVALKNDGTVWAWGRNADGQIGDNSTTTRWTPVQVNGLAEVKAIAAGKSHTVALKEDGTVWAWGDGLYGQLGYGVITDSKTPVQATDLTGIKCIAAGDYHTAAVKEDGTLWAWGRNNYGQLGDGTDTDSWIPVAITGITGVSFVDAGYGRTTALRDDNSVWDWGHNDFGQLGDGSNTDRWTPHEITGLTDITMVSAGFEYAIAIKSDGTAWAWGHNDYGQLGDGTNTDRWAPVQLTGLNEVKTVTNGLAHTVTLRSDGTVWSWGYNYNGQIGDGTKSSRYPLVKVDGPGDVKAAAAGAGHTVCVHMDGTVWSWGYNYNGQIGDGTNTSRFTPVGVTGISDVKSVAAGQGHTVALKNDGTVWAWGYNYGGQLGNNSYTDSPTPVQVSGLSGVIAVSAGYLYSAALKGDGTVWTWGYNGYGQLGDSTYSTSKIPVQVANITDITAIAAGGSHMVALKGDGTVWAWGHNGYGQLGDGTNTNKNIPVQVGILNVKSIAAGGYHTVVLRDDNTVWACGYNLNGQLGDLTTTNRNTPVQVTGFSGVMAVAAGDIHTLAVISDGTVWAWGNNYGGQVNYDTPGTSVPTPVQVAGLGYVTAIYGGGSHSVALQGETEPPSSTITSPIGGASVSGLAYTVTGTSGDGAGSGVAFVEVSTDGGNSWSAASDISAGSDWSTWSFNWTLPANGEYTVLSRATDKAGNAELPGPGVTVTVQSDGTPPSSAITSPADGANLADATCMITGTADDGTGSGVDYVEVSINGGLTWEYADGTTSWSYLWNIGSPGGHNIRSRATDIAGNVETPGAGINVSVSKGGVPELVHYDWDVWAANEKCALCHLTEDTFISQGVRERPEFCLSCHNPSAPAHDRSLTGLREHTVFHSVTSTGCTVPTYGNITSPEYDNRMYAHLMDSDKVVCVTCHNPMRRSEDFGRVWEYTTTSDNQTYALQNGGWSAYGGLAPQVYRDNSLWSGPAYVKDKKQYLSPPSQYSYNEKAGTVTFNEEQSVLTYVYVTLDFPYLRVTVASDTLCADCHTEATHMGANCLTCHMSHNTDNIGVIREVVRTTDRSELAVVFMRYTGTNSFADGNGTYDGICEVCHTQTLYHRRDGSGAAHYGGQDCTACHGHLSGFAR